VTSTLYDPVSNPSPKRRSFCPPSVVFSKPLPSGSAVSMDAATDPLNRSTVSPEPKSPGRASGPAAELSKVSMVWAPGVRSKVARVS